MTKTSEMTIGQFLDELAGDQSTPGGGGASALTGSQGAALVSMVLQFTVGKKKYAAIEDELQSYLQQTEELRAQLLGYADKDVDAFNAVVACYSMPKETDADKAARTAAMQSALKGAMMVSMEIAELSLKTIKLSEPVGAKGNPNVVSDAATGAYLAYASIRGALINVNINLKFVKDDDYVSTWQSKAQALLTDADNALAKSKQACAETLKISI